MKKDQLGLPTGKGGKSSRQGSASYNDDEPPAFKFKP